jgi:hypothetical protein
MNLYKIVRTDDYWGDDDYVSAVVVAANEQEARLMNPEGDALCWVEGGWKRKDRNGEYEFAYTNWCNPEDLRITCIGVTQMSKGVILAALSDMWDLK